jgi:hypothetical protein
MTRTYGVCCLAQAAVQGHTWQQDEILAWSPHAKRLVILTRNNANTKRDKMC